MPFGLIQRRLTALGTKLPVCSWVGGRQKRTCSQEMGYSRHRPIADPGGGEHLSLMRLAWVTFWLFVVVSWPAVGFYMFIAGGASCKLTGHCLLDGIVLWFAIALLPLQALIAVYLKQRSSN
jgi:hypothetical protein